MNTSSTHLLALSSVARRGQCCLQLLETVIVDVIHTQQSGIHDFLPVTMFLLYIKSGKTLQPGKRIQVACAG